MEGHCHNIQRGEDFLYVFQLRLAEEGQEGRGEVQWGWQICGSWWFNAVPNVVPGGKIDFDMYLSGDSGRHRRGLWPVSQSVEGNGTSRND